MNCALRCPRPSRIANEAKRRSDRRIEGVLSQAFGKGEAPAWR
jgi:hypothetical protein